jgi:xanthine dehydrogenase YagR molybdenum-binding subunit
MSTILKRAARSIIDLAASRAVAGAPDPAFVVAGAPLDRVDGVQKVTGAAQYPSDKMLPDMAYAALVTSTIARGSVTSVDTTEAAACPGVLTILTHQNAPRLKKNLIPQLGAGRWSVGRDFLPLQDARVRFAGQPVAMVVAETRAQAIDAASRVRVAYAAEPAVTDLSQVVADGHPAKLRIGKPDHARGDAQLAFQSAPVSVDAEYATPPQTNNPLGLFATVAYWDGDSLTVFDANQFTKNVQRSAASVFGLWGGRGSVQVVSPYVGGGFGAGLRAWPHTWLAAMAARGVDRPVKLELTRQQMFTAVGRRAQTLQHVRLGAERDGTLTAIIHDAVHDTSRDEEFVEALTSVSRLLYACPNVETHYRVANLDRSTPTYMRCPGESETLFALESAMDELAVALEIDPIALRRQNYASRDVERVREWSSNSLRECYARGAEIFDWSRRTPAPGSMRDGETLIGLGTATAFYPAFTLPAKVEAWLDREGNVVVRSAATDIGPGTATAMVQIAADTLGVAPSRVRFELGDSRLPMAPQQGGSTIVASVGSAVFATCTKLRERAIALARSDPASALWQVDEHSITVDDGVLKVVEDRSRFDRYDAIVARTGQDTLSITASSSSLLPRMSRSCQAFGAQFVEVHIDASLRTIRVPRMVGVFGVGRVVNPKLARSQLMGGMIWGLSQALLEETVYDHRLNRIVNASLGDYLVPVNADVERVEVEFVAEDDPYVNPLGVKGVGEIGMAGVAPAIANAVYHATGKRVRELPITIEKLL